jgi:hypothetical protein
MAGQGRRVRPAESSSKNCRSNGLVRQHNSSLRQAGAAPRLESRSEELDAMGEHGRMATNLNQIASNATQHLVATQEPQRRGNARRPVSRVLSPPLPAGDDHSSRVPVARHLARPTRATARKHACPANRTCRPYLVLLRVGFAMPPLLPGARCALTAPFHPYPWAEARGRFAFCCTVPGVAPAGRYPAPLFPWSPDFPRRRPCGRRRGHPAVWPLLRK